MRHHPVGPNPRGSGSARPEGERGETLIEVMVTVILLGTAIVGILGGMLAVINVSRINSDRSRANIVAQNYAEQLKAAVDDGFETSLRAGYIPCAEVSTGGSDQTRFYPDYRAQFENKIFSGFSARISRIEYGTISGGAVTWSDTCTKVAMPAAYAPLYTIPFTDGGLQRIHIEALSRAGDRQVKELVVIVKRDQRCPATYDNADTGPC